MMNNNTNNPQTNNGGLISEDFLKVANVLEEIYSEIARELDKSGKFPNWDCESIKIELEAVLNDHLNYWYDEVFQSCDPNNHDACKTKLMSLINGLCKGKHEDLLVDQYQKGDMGL